MTTTHIGLNVTDTWHLVLFHSLLPVQVSRLYNEGRVTLRSFAGILSAELLKLADIEDENSRILQKRQLAMSSDNEEDEVVNNGTVVVDMDVDSGEVVTGPPSYFYMTKSGRRIDNCKRIDTEIDGNGNSHTLTRFPIVQTGKRQKRRALAQKCDTCGKDTTMFCYECGISYCYSKGNSGHGRKCFQHHIPSRTCRNVNTSL